MEAAGGKSGLVGWMMVVAAGIWMLLPMVESASSCPDPQSGPIPCPMNQVENLTCSYARGIPSELPTLPPDTDPPGKPNELIPTPYLKYDSSKCIAYLNITWKINPYACRSLQGFILNVTFVLDGIQRYINRTYSVSVGNRTDRNLLSQTTLGHECIVPSPSIPYEITVQSLPKSDWNDKNFASTVYRQTVSATAMSSCENPDNPDLTANWTATMWFSQSSSENTRNASLEVCFFFAPVVFGFEEYKMSLKNFSNPNSGVELAWKYIYDNGTQENRQECVKFDKVCPGIYRVELTPIAKILTYGSNEQCTCRYGRRPEDCRDICTSTVLEPIDMTNSVCVATTTEAATTATVAAEPPRDIPATSRPDYSATEPPMPSTPPVIVSSEASLGFSSGKIGGIVVGVILAIVLVTAVVLLLLFRRTCRSEKLPVLDSASPDDEMQISTLPKRHRVLLVYSTDNESHRKVIRSFAAFLHACCGCDVLYDEWSQMDIAQTNPIDWLSKQMYGVKQVVVVNSLGAYEQHRGWIEQKLYVPKTNLLLPDVFIPAIRQVQSKVFSGCPQFRCFHVCFPYTDQKHVLNLSGGKCYKLMDHIEELFLHIHGLTKFSPKGTTSADQINAANYYLTAKEGISLRRAIEEATDFARETPNWFQSYYRRDDNVDVTDNNNTTMPRGDLYLYSRIESSQADNARTAGGSDSSSIGTASDIVYFAPSMQDSGDELGHSASSPDAGIGGMGDRAASSSSCIPSPSEPKFLLFAPLPPEDMGDDDSSSIGSRYVVAKINELNDQYDSGLSASMQDLSAINQQSTSNQSAIN